MDYIAICKAFCGATGIPANLRTRETGKVIFSSLADMLEYKIEGVWLTFYEETNPVFCRLSPEIEYGLVRIEGTEYDMVIGPVFGVTPSEKVISAFLVEAAVPAAYKERITEYLMAIPRISHARYTWLLLMLHMWLNGKNVEPQQFYANMGSETAAEHVAKEALESRLQNMETVNLHNSQGFERRLYGTIRDGDLNGLNKLLTSELDGLREGRLAASPLRQAKNLFIVNTARVVSLAAIPGGLGAEEANQLMDTYIQECEQLQNIDAVYTLQGAMMRDYCRRIRLSKLPEGISSEIFECINYIRINTNSQISAKDIADHIDRSTSYLFKRFKAETGKTVNDFITECKLSEAKKLLKHSNKTLAEISNYLCFSSQSYFQSVFKKEFGVTPSEYRKNGKT
ncbi:MAG: helix-turn-helix transcriptional regulator [Firmicutes bacterium]|nr:helix-turn-helix transcriptional regulator [[Eubacterium] siraeum]MCM1488655.1 helix-turn-helix transcriptional regulator [Bacillota bacterium]